MEIPKTLLGCFHSIKSHWQNAKKISAIHSEIADANPLQLIIGAGTTDYAGWIATDVDVLNIYDQSSWNQLFKAGSIDRILCEHVFEHLTLEEMCVALSCCLRFLKPGGVLRLAVPDGYRNDSYYINEICPPKDGHKQMLNIDILGKVLNEIGFFVSPLEYFTKNGQFISRQWNPEEGIILRSKPFDRQVAFKRADLFYTSLIIDAIKPLTY